MKLRIIMNSISAVHIQFRVPDPRKYQLYRILYYYTTLLVFECHLQSHQKCREKILWHV